MSKAAVKRPKPKPKPKPTSRLKPRPKPTSKPKRAQTTMTSEARAMYVEVQRCAGQLEKSVGEIQRGLRRAERQLEADARSRIRELRKEARVQMHLLRTKQREAAAALTRVSAAAGGTWDDITRAVEAFLADARATAAAAVERFRTALGG